MNSRNAIAILALFLAAITNGCASSHSQVPNNLSPCPAYSSVKLDEGIFRISFVGESLTTSTASADFARFSGAEIAMKNGYQFFYIHKFFVTSGTPPTNTFIIRCLNTRPADAPAAVHDAAQLSRKLNSQPIHLKLTPAN